MIVRRGLSSAVALAGVLLLAVPGCAQDTGSAGIVDAREAYQTGDYERAARIYRSLARAGEARGLVAGLGFPLRLNQSIGGDVPAERVGRRGQVDDPVDEVVVGAGRPVIGVPVTGQLDRDQAQVRAALEQGLGQGHEGGGVVQPAVNGQHLAPVWGPPGEASQGSSGHLESNRLSAHARRSYSLLTRAPYSRLRASG